MVEIPDETIAASVVTRALEYGEYEECHDTAAEGQYGQHEYDTEWSLHDLLDGNPDVDMVDETTVAVTGEIEARYSVKVRRARRNPPGKAHPAEYDTRYVELYVAIEDDLAAPLEPPRIFVE